MSEGYIYVLANASMPDVVKVGKTVRQPSLRAQELSGVTGVPTPFMVVYERFVADCDSAEQFVHTFLERKGYRVNQNREFFSAPVTEAIKAVLEIPDAFIEEPVSTEGDEDLLTSEEPDELRRLVVGQELRRPWSAIWDEAWANEYGDEDHIVDYAEALRLYKDAARLGCSVAYRKIGTFYLLGRVPNKTIDAAIMFYKEGIKKGDYGCYLNLAHTFLSTNQIDNANKCLNLFFRDREMHFDPVVEDLSVSLDFDLAAVLTNHIEHLGKLSPHNKAELIKVADDLFYEVNDYLESANDTDDADSVAEYEIFRQWLEKLCEQHFSEVGDCALS